MLGIFQHKKKEYNRLILKSLVGGPKTTTQIAEYIYLNRKRDLNRKMSIKPKRLNGNKVKQIVGIISRRTEKQKGRLQELEAKHYIKKDTNLYRLTMKGRPVALTLFSDITKAWPYVVNESTELFMRDIVNELDDIPYLEQIPFAKDFLDKGKIAKALRVGLSPRFMTRFIEMLRDCTNDFINQGLNIDDMDEHEFSRYLINEVMLRFGRTGHFVEIREILEGKEGKEP